MARILAVAGKGTLAGGARRAEARAGSQEGEWGMTRHKPHNPVGVAAPAGPYTHGIEVAPNARWLHISGQVGTAPDGSVPADIEAQAANCWRNIRGILESAAMTMDDLVKVTVFLTSEANIGPYRAARDRLIGAARPASTLVVVSRLVRPEWVVEIEAVAARA
jgi:enamine deaminase RidA (YjgF/YER057c/UK114 family)